MLVEIWDNAYHVSWPRKAPTVYLRYGLFSGREVSSNHSTGEAEAGLSVYPAVLENGVVHLHPDWETCPSLANQGRLCFAVTGREVGTGSDGEPVLRGVRMLPYPLALDLRR